MIRCLVVEDNSFDRKVLRQTADDFCLILEPRLSGRPLQAELY